MLSEPKLKQMNNVTFHIEKMFVGTAYLVLPSLLLLQIPQPLLFGAEQLVLVVDLLLLPQRHRAKLTQCELHPFPQL